jgi:competence protein ComEC
LHIPETDAGGSAMTARPFFPLLTALIAGITCGSFFAIPDLPAQLALGATLSLLLLSRLRGWRPLFLPLILIALSLLGLLEMNLLLWNSPGKDHIVFSLGEKKLSIEGMICENPQVSPEKTELVVSASRILRDGRAIPVSGRVLLNVRHPVSLRYGDVIRFHSRLRAPHNFNNPGGFDYERHLRFRGILVRGSVHDASGLVLLRREQGNFLRAGLDRFRGRIREILRREAPEDEGRILQALILGDRREIPDDVVENFNRTGTTHIIAISGLHIGIVAAFSLFLIRLILKSSEWLLLKWNVLRLSALLAVPAVLLYTFIAGAGISVVRASIMVLVFLWAILLERERDLFNTLALAAFAILIVAPHSLFDVSFQLSFAAVASLLFLAPKLGALLPPLPPSGSAPSVRERLMNLFRKGAHGVALFFFVSLAATLSTLPLILLYFNRLSLVSLAANLLVVPLLGALTVPLGLLIILAVPVSATAAAWIIRFAEIPVGLALQAIERFASLPYASLYLPTPTLPEIAAWYLLLLWAGLLLECRKNPGGEGIFHKPLLLGKIIPGILILFAIIDGAYYSFGGFRGNRLSLTAVDVGQGNAVLIRFPTGRTMLIDGGGFADGSFDIGKNVLAPFLWRERIVRIDTVVLTHPHPDHLQGLLFVLEHFGVKEAWTNGDETEADAAESFREAIRKKKIALKVLSDETPEMEAAGVRIRVLNPQKGLESSGGGEAIVAGRPDGPVAPGGLPAAGYRGQEKAGRSSEALNDRSLVMKISFGRRSFLLPADITGQSERRLLEGGADLRSDAILVPHHGSARSSTPLFLDKVRAEAAVISCGADNIYGCPHPDVLRRFETRGTQIFRTDLHGAVTLSTDGEDLRTAVFLPNPRPRRLPAIR